MHMRASDVEIQFGNLNKNLGTTAEEEDLLKAIQSIIRFIISYSKYCTSVCIRRKITAEMPYSVGLSVHVFYNRQNLYSAVQ